MTSLTKIFELVQYNDYEELDKIIKYTKIDLGLSNRRNEFLIPNAIKYRSKECFELLIESKYFNINNSEKNGLKISIEYYCNAMNESNSYYLMRLLGKGVEFKLDIFHHIFKYGFPEIFNEYLINILNQNNFEQIFSYSLINSISMKKLLNIGFQYNLITEIVGCACLSNIGNNIYECLLEFINNNLNVFNNKENVLKYFYKNFDAPLTIKYLVDNINKFNPNLDLSDLIINYCHNQSEHYNYIHNTYRTNYYIRMYHILINFESLKNLNSKFIGIENIIRNIFDENKIESLIEYNEINYNKILIIIKILDLLFSEKYLNENSNIYPNEKLIINKPQQPHAITKYYKKILILQFLIKYIETKNVKLSDKVLHILEIEIPDNYYINIKSMLPKKVKPLK